MAIVVIEMLGFIALVLHFVAAHAAEFENFEVATNRRVRRRVRFADEAAARGARGLNARPRRPRVNNDGGAVDFAEPQRRWQQQQPLPPREPIALLEDIVGAVFARPPRDPIPLLDVLVGPPPPPRPGEHAGNQPELPPLDALPRGRNHPGAPPPGRLLAAPAALPPLMPEAAEEEEVAVAAAMAAMFNQILNEAAAGAVALGPRPPPPPPPQLLRLPEAAPPEALIAAPPSEPAADVAPSG